MDAHGNRVARLLPLASAGATEDALRDLEEQIGFDLPDDLRSFLLVSDGSEDVEFPGTFFQVYSVRQMAQIAAERYDIADKLGERLVDIASDCGREGWCLSADRAGIIMADVLGDERVLWCDSFTELVIRLHDGADPFWWVQS